MSKNATQKALDHISAAKIVGILNQPVSSIAWVDRALLRPNLYNPNTVAPPEMDLLEISILEDGWTQPIVTLAPAEDGSREIVDGFHRFTVSERSSIHAMTGGLVPVATVTADQAHQMMSTIRHNRARGTHGINPMSAIVQAIQESGVPLEEICRRLGMEDEEVERLTLNAGMPEFMQGHATEFRQAWVPDGSHKKQP